MATRRRWTQDSIRSELAPIVAELGRMPSRRELTDRGLGGAWSAMHRHGGIAAWRLEFIASPDSQTIAAVTPARAPVAAPAVVAVLTSPAAAAPPSRHEIAQRAYFIALQGGGDPVANWLAAESELLAA